MSAKITISISDTNFSEAMRLFFENSAQIKELLDLPNVELSLEAEGIDVKWGAKALNALRHHHTQSEYQ